MDVKTAFLNGHPKEEVFMDQPEGFQLKKRSIWCVSLRNQYMD